MSVTLLRTATHIPWLAYVVAALGLACTDSTDPADSGRDADAGADTSVGTADGSDGTTNGKDATFGRMYAPHSWILGPMMGSSCPVYGDCSAPGVDAGLSDPSPAHLAEVRHQLAKLREYDIPITSYHFDGPAWSTVGSCNWNLGSDILNELRSGGMRALLHVWGGCLQGQWGIEKNSGKLCGCYLQSDWDRIHSQVGDVLGGFYSDDGFSDDAWIESMMNWAHKTLPQPEVVMKAFAVYPTDPELLQSDEALHKFGHTCFVNDKPSDFEGMQVGIRRVFEKGHLLAAPYNEFTSYDGSHSPDEETYYRRVHFGALQMVMDNSPWMAANPWEVSPGLLTAYRYYSWLHIELIPYLFSYDYAMYETDESVFRESHATAEGVVPFEASTLLGNEVFVAYVGEAGRTSIDIDLPAGEWVDYWNLARVLSGPARISQAVPLGKEPIFIRNGSILPLDVRRDVTGHGTAESAGSLTAWVLPAGDGSFRYRDEKDNKWFVFSSSLQSGKLTLRSSPWPSRPVIFRVDRWPTAPGGVSANGDGVETGATGTLPRLTSEAAVNGATSSAWFHDATAQRLLIKIVGEPARAARRRAP
jgi:hypothetical protein